MEPKSNYFVPKQQIMIARNVFEMIKIYGWFLKLRFVCPVE
jgi:hypothetical protein